MLKNVKYEMQEQKKISSNTINYTNDKDLMIYPKKERIIVSKIDNLYLSIRETPIYFLKLKILMFISSTLLYSIIWSFYTMISTPRNNMYCFSSSSLEFINCDPDDFCNEGGMGVINYIYVNDNNIFNVTDSVANQEIIKINEIFKNYFLQEFVLYTKLNYNNIDKLDEVSDYFKNVIVIAYKEHFNIFLTFCQACNRNNLIFELVIFLLTGYSVGNLFVCFLADLNGRKRLLGMNCICCGMASIGIGIFTLILLNSSKVRFNNNLFKLPLQYQYTNDIYSNYLENVVFIQENIQTSNLIIQNFSSYRIVFYLLIFVIGINLTSSINIIKAFLLEQSINDTEIYNNYNYMYYGLILSYFLVNLFDKIFDSFLIKYMVVGVSLILIGVLILFILDESPRHQYEFFEYDKLTDFFLKNIKTDDLKKFYLKNSEEKIQNEINKNKISQEETYFKGLLKLLIDFKFQKSNFKIKEKYIDIYRSDITKNPFLLFSLMNQNKHIRRHFLIILSLVINIALVYYLTIINLFKNYVVEKRKLYDLFDYKIFLITIIFYISQMFFFFLMKFFGFNIILLICFFMNLIFSLIFQMNDTFMVEEYDMNRYFFYNNNIIYNNNRNFFFVSICFMTFFSHGLFFTLYLYLTRFTKTIYRCLFYGIFQIFIDLIMIFSNCMNLYFNKTIPIITIASLIGLVNAFFVNQDFEYNIISDYRNLDIKITKEKNRVV